MKKFNDEQIVEMNLEFTPLTKQLMINYMKWQYEDAADFSDESIKREFWLLKDDNRLSEIFISEWLYSETRFKG